MKCHRAAGGAPAAHRRVHHLVDDKVVGRADEARRGSGCDAERPPRDDFQLDHSGTVSFADRNATAADRSAPRKSSSTMLKRRRHDEYHEGRRAVDGAGCG